MPLGTAFGSGHGSALLVGSRSHWGRLSLTTAALRHIVQLGVLKSQQRCEFFWEMGACGFPHGLETEGEDVMVDVSQRFAFGGLGLKGINQGTGTLGACVCEMKRVLKVYQFIGEWFYRLCYTLH
jgi:hypothetical protein